MHIQTKIKAFTLTEMIVVLVITSIVAGLAFTILSLVQKQMIGIQRNFEHQTSVQLLEQSLYKDINDCSLIRYNELDDTIKFKSLLDSIEYQFYTSFIAKNKDTFSLNVQSKTFFLEGERVKGGAFDAVKLIIDNQGYQTPIFMYKKKDAAYYMN